MQLVYLAFKGAGHHPLAQSLDAVHLGFYQASPMVDSDNLPSSLVFYNPLTLQTQAKQVLVRQSKLKAASPVASGMSDRHGGLRWSSPLVQKVTGYGVGCPNDRRSIGDSL